VKTEERKRARAPRRDEGLPIKVIEEYAGITRPEWLD